MAVHINTLNGGNITIGAGGSPAPAGHADTWYKYAGDTEWRTVNISGTINNDSENYGPTTQIPNVANIVELEIGTDVTNVEHESFMNCMDIISVVIPNSVQKIGWSAFEYDNKIETITIGSGIQTIESAAFGECSSL